MQNYITCWFKVGAGLLRMMVEAGRRLFGPAGWLVELGW